jgi:hypothetical protein
MEEKGHSFQFISDDCSTFGNGSEATELDLGEG